jgi:hypothetical protein
LRSSRRLEDAMMEQQDFWRWMQRLTQGLSVGTVAMAVMMGVPSEGRETPDDARHRTAMAAYQAGRWSEAYVALAALADAGDADAARVAGMMVRQGPLLFGQRFEASPERQAAWARLTGIEAALLQRPVVRRPDERGEPGEPGEHETRGERGETVAAR